MANDEETRSDVTIVQLTAVEEIDQITEKLSEHLSELDPNMLGTSHLIVFGKLFLYSLEGYRKELSVEPPRFGDELRSAINRQLASNLLLCAEAGLKDFATEIGSSIINKRELNSLGIATYLLRKFGNQISGDVKKWLKNFNGKRISNPDFFDLLDFALSKITLFPVNETKHLRRFFELLTLVRNKASHLDVSLKAHEIELIEEFSLKPSNPIRLQISILSEEGVDQYIVTFIFFHQAWWHIAQAFSLLGAELNCMSE